MSPRMREEMEMMVYKVLEDIEYDPDYGLELRPSFVRELKRRIASKGKNIPFAEVKRRLGLK